MKRFQLITAALAMATIWLTANQGAAACPFCSAVSQTLRQEMSTMDAVAIAESTRDSIRDELTGSVSFKVISVLKGDSLVKAGETVKAVYYGSVEPGRRFMLSGADPSQIQWSCLPITDISEKYLQDIAKLPDDPLERLKFYQAYLQDKDPMLNRDAYDEFAITPYAVVKALKPFMNHDQLVSWIKDPEMPADRKRLYLTMLGVCGDEKDLPMLKEQLTSTQPSSRGGLDAMIACYLVLAGEDGLPLIDELFLANDKSPYADTYAAIMAIRFHGTETDVIPRSALVPSLHHVLNRADLADLVIPDLARWGDWSQIDRLVELFKKAEKDNNWIRVPVVNYLRACPKPEAATALEQLKQIDPDSVRRASSFLAIPAPSAPSPGSSSYNLPSTPSRLPEPATELDWPVGNDQEFLTSSSNLASLTRTEHAFAIATGGMRSLGPQPVDVNRLTVTVVMGGLMLAFGAVFAWIFQGGANAKQTSTDSSPVV